MKVLFNKILLVCVLSFLVLVSTSLFLNKFWGNNFLRKKIECVKSLDADYNTLFLGSSRVNHHIKASIFDSLTNSKNKSFNLGIGAGSYYENFAALKELLKYKKIERVYIQYYGYWGGNHPGATNIQRSYFWDLDLLWSALNKSKNDYKEIKWHFEFLLRRYFLTGHGKDIIMYNLYSSKRKIIKVVNNIKFLRSERLNNILEKLEKKEGSICSNSGFMPLMPRKLSEAKQIKFDSWYKKFEKGNTRSYNDETVTMNESSEIFYQELQSFLDEKNIELYVIYEPNNFQYYKSKIRNKIYMGDGKDFPEYFEKQYWWDLGIHLNDNGATVFTNQLAKKVNMYSK